MVSKPPVEVDPENSIPASDIRAALQEILRSEAFGNSKRCCDFLSYVVEQAVAGARHELKERTIAVAVFGRNPSYDSHEDAVVRITATEVRKRLGQYYASPRKATIRVSLPRGGYIPVFTQHDGSAVAGSHDVLRSEAEPRYRAADESGEKSAVPSGDRSRKSWRVAAITALCIIGAVAAWAWFSLRPQQTFLNEFWAPALHRATPVYVVAAAAPVFVSYAPGENLPITTKTEYVATTDQFVGQGDLLASHLIAGMLQRMRQPYEVKANDTLDVRELPSHSVVLIGYSSTQWESICKQLRFYIDGERAGMITDWGKDTEWYPRHLTKDLHTDEDYAIVSRFFDPNTRAMVVLVSGATQYGTEGAAMLVTDANLLRAALKDRPAGWERKNIQIVLHMRVIANSPATPEVVAAYYW